LPRAARVHVHTDAARVRAEGFAGGELFLSTEAGVIAIADVDVRLRLRSAAGKITGERVSGSLDVETHAGAIQLDIARLDDGKHRVRADVGAVRVELAPDVDVVVDAKTTMGAVKVDRVHLHGDGPHDARARLTVTTEVGSIRVRQRRTGDDHVRAERKHARAHRVRRRHASFGVVTDLADAAREAIHEVAEEVMAATGASAVGGGATSAGVRATGPVRTSDDEMRRVLEMVADGTLSPKEAQELLRAMDMV
jgi:hypothetical protein